MARGAEGKLRRRNQKKEARAQAEQMLKEGEEEEDQGAGEMEFPGPKTDMKSRSGPVVEDVNSSDDDDDDIDVPPPSKKSSSSKGSKNKYTDKAAKAAVAVSGKKEGIKTLPLIFLVILTGSTLLPGLIFVGDWVGNAFQKNNVIGSIGYRLGVGATPKKRVLSFYEKHDPEKVPQIPSILGKYYGDYPTLIKKLERKYQDYGYFINWEQDEAAFTLAMEKLDETREYMQLQWNRHAPQALKTAARNANANFKFLYKRGKKFWKKHLWPLLEPIFGVPKGAAQQKREDAAAARKAKAAASGRRSKNRDYRDDEE